MKPLNVVDCMNPSVITVSNEAPLPEAVALMQKHKISALVVVDHSGHMVGVLSQTDVLRAWQQGSNYGAVSDKSVGEFMTRDVISTLPHKSLEYAMALLNRHKIHRLIVAESQDGGRFVSDRMKPIGILSQTDIVQALVADSNDAVTAGDTGAGGLGGPTSMA